MGSFRRQILNRLWRAMQRDQSSAALSPRAASLWFEPIEQRVLLSGTDPLDTGNNDAPIVALADEVTNIPTLAVKGNSTTIATGDITPSVDDFTDFWYAGIANTSVTRTFFLTNTGTAALNLTGTDLIQITGDNAADFTVTAQPATTLNPAGSTSFTITFNPSAAGMRKATVTIASNDPNQPAFTFDIQGLGIETTALTGGLEIATTNPGTGRQVVNGDKLSVNYTGRLLTGSKFDSSLNEGRSPFQFTIGSGQVIQGWEKGILGMKVGETRVLIIPAALAYGSTAREGIPANSDLIFDVTLLSIAGSQIEVRGNAVVIANNDNTPSTTDNTDFGSLAINSTTGTSKNFNVITNKGAATLKLTGIPAIQISGANASDFTVSQPTGGTNQVTFTVVFNPQTGATGTRTAIISIASNDPDTPVFSYTIAGTATEQVTPTNATVSVADASVVEGNTGFTTMNFVVTLSQTRDTAVTLNYKLQPVTAKAGADYEALQGQLIFSPGQTQRTIAVQIKGDTTIEADETLMFVLSNVTGTAVVLGRSVAAGTIVNDDLPVISIALKGKAREDQAGSNSRGGFTISRSGATGVPVIVSIAKSGTATAGLDYTALPATVTIPAGKRSVFVPLTVTSDLLGEPTETVIVNLQANAQAYTINPMRASATQQIIDDEPVAKITAVRNGFESPTVRNQLGQFKVSLDRVAAVAVTLQYSISGSATMGSDYNAQTMRVTIPAGARFALIEITPTNDTDVEGNESLTVTLLDLPSSGYSLSPVLADRLATIQIIDND